MEWKTQSNKTADPGTEFLKGYRDKTRQYLTMPSLFQQVEIAYFFFFKI